MSSRPAGPIRLPSQTKTRRRAFPSTATADERAAAARRASLSSGVPKAKRTSKTSQKLVVLPSAPQTKPLISDFDEDETLGYETRGGVSVREYKSAAERMTKEQREEAGFKRLTAYCVAEDLRMKLLASFLKREHNVAPRVFDEAMYVAYHLPLLPGYGPETNIRSSAPAKPIQGESFLSHLSEAEEEGYQGTYFNAPSPQIERNDGYISASPLETRRHIDNAIVPHSPTSNEFLGESETEPMLPSESEQEPEPEHEREHEALIGGVPSSVETEVPSRPHVRWQTQSPPPRPSPPIRSRTYESDINVAEVVFFEYGVVVFFGMEERHEMDILEDITKAGVLKRPITQKDWEIEQCHFTHDPNITNPRIFNDFFTLRSRSHLLKLSIAHALAQSTLLAHYETNAQHVLSSPLALSIPQQLAQSGKLQLRRREALKLTGRLFKLRRDVNLVSNVLDVPELFWSEASLGELYEAVREYMEIKGRVQVLNEKLGIASDFLEAIHDHLNNNEMARITWVIIWLIVIAVLVELGEIIARLVVHSALKTEPTLTAISREESLRTLERMMNINSSSSPL